MSGSKRAISPFSTSLPICVVYGRRLLGAMQRFWSLYIAIWCLLLAMASVEAEVLDAALCAGKESCGKLSAPFWTDKDCAASPSFFLSDCNSARAYWDAFKDAVFSDIDKLGPPELLGTMKEDNLTFITLTWSTDEASENPCSPPFPSSEVGGRLPDLINLTAFAEGALRFSPRSYFLLFGCNPELAKAPNVKNESAACSAYKGHCKTDLPCVQLEPYQELALGKTLKSNSCSSFTFLAAGSPFESPSEWHPAAIQVLYGDPQCQTCTNGSKHCQTSDCENGCSSFKCNTAAIVGIAVSATFGIIACTVTVLWWRHRRRSAYTTRTVSPQSSKHLLTQRACLLSKKFGPVAAKEFSFQSLSKATKSFSEESMIGDGGFGAVYLGTLKDSRKVAIKRLYHDKFRRMDQFYNEIQILSSIDHPNLVKLYGFCCQDMNDLLLVFEYAANGTVFDQIHDTEKPRMPWKTRLRILRETAEALSYLHNFVKPPIYHRDVKTTNILLDENLHVKLADFGLSRFVPLEATHVSTAPQGTPGYLDPDYHQCYQLTDKSDVYSFGVVLVELVSAKLAVDMSRDRSEINLSSLALMKIGCGMWQDLVDPHLGMAKNPNVEVTVKGVLELAFMCLHAEKDNRPTIRYVAESLSKVYCEFGYDDERVNGGVFKMDISPTSSDSSNSYNSSSSGP